MSKVLAKACSCLPPLLRAPGHAGPTLGLPLTSEPPSDACARCTAGTILASQFAGRQDVPGGTSLSLQWSISPARCSPCRSHPHRLRQPARRKGQGVRKGAAAARHCAPRVGGGQHTRGAPAAGEPGRALPIMWALPSGMPPFRCRLPACWDSSCPCVSAGWTAYSPLSLRVSPLDRFSPTLGADPGLCPAAASGCPRAAQAQGVPEGKQLGWD